MDKELIAFMISKKIEALKAIVSYYDNGFYPELRELTGSDQYTHRDRAQKKLDDFLVDVNDCRVSGHTSYLKFTDTERANYLRVYAIEQRELADTWADSNVFIKWRSLRRCITALNMLKEMLPDLGIYSNHWLASRNIIKLN